MSDHHATRTEGDGQDVVTDLGTNGVKNGDPNGKHGLLRLKLLTKTVVLGLSALLCPFGIPAARAQTTRRAELSARQIAQQTFPSVVVLVAESSDSTSSSLGSGFFVDTDLIVTSYHVIKGATKIVAKIVGQKGVYDVSKIIRVDEERDLALLKVEGARARSLPLATSYRPGVGDMVYVAGNPEGLEGTFSQGIVSALRGTKYIQISAPISHGSSGGPVLNSRGEVIGVAAGAIEEGQNLNFAIPLSPFWPLTRRSNASASSKGSKRRGVPVEVVEALPDEVVHYVDEGFDLENQAKYAEAAEAYKKALKLEPDWEGALYGLASAYEHLGRFNEAIQVYKDLIRLNPKEEQHYNELADLYVRMDRIEEAMALYKETIRTIPSATFSYTELAGLLEQHHRMQEAEDVLKSAIRRKPQAEFYFALGTHYCIWLKQPKEAIRYYEAAVRLWSKNSYAHFVLGETYLEVGDRVSAIREYQLLKRLAPTFAESLFKEIYK